MLFQPTISTFYYRIKSNDNNLHKYLLCTLVEKPLKREVYFKTRCVWLDERKRSLTSLKCICEGFYGDEGTIRDVGFNYYLMVSAEWKGKEFIFLNLKFIVRLICLFVKWECENLRMNKMYIYEILKRWRSWSMLVSSTRSLIMVARGYRTKSHTLKGQSPSFFSFFKCVVSEILGRDWSNL